MRRLVTLNMWVLTLPLFLAVVMLAPSGAPAKQKSDAGKAGGRLSGQVGYSRVSPPQAGVKLLESIFNRVRSAPQLAMARGLMQKQESAQSLPQQGPTDYRLAIKPRESAWSPPKSFPKDSDKMVYGDEGIFADDLTPADAKRKGIWDSEKMKEAAGLDERKSDKLAYSPPPAVAPRVQRAENRTYGGGGYGGSGVWETDQGRGRAAAAAPEPLANAAGKLYDLSKKLGAVTSGNEAEAERRDATARGGAPVVNWERARRQVAAGGIVSAALKGQGVSEYRGKPTATPTPAPSPKPAEEQLRAGADEAVVNIPMLPPAGNVGNKSRSRESQIALLPPTVVTGIPIVRLGAAEAQANRTLAAVGSMKQTQVGEWTVWSYTRPGSNQALLQVFVRHGQVEALRIFDNKFVDGDLGVRVGDNLAAVKRRFGEPSFILSEPQPGAGQNYVYPISQVGFLLARPSPGAVPQVNSLLIFNVK